MTKESIFTNKLFALLNRTGLANRDIYDIYYFFKQNIDFDIELLEKKVLKNYIEYFKDIISFLKNIKKSHSILEGL
jgi:predicted nucleotidyltransferase component of viral defense system